MGEKAEDRPQGLKPLFHVGLKMALLKPCPDERKTKNPPEEKKKARV
jgi:hypothetical protein